VADDVRQCRMLSTGQCPFYLPDSYVQPGGKGDLTTFCSIRTVQPGGWSDLTVLYEPEKLCFVGGMILFANFSPTSASSVANIDVIISFENCFFSRNRRTTPVWSN